MGSDPQSYLIAMEEAAHRECREKERALEVVITRLRAEIESCKATIQLLSHTDDVQMIINSLEDVKAGRVVPLGAIDREFETDKQKALRASHAELLAALGDMLPLAGVHISIEHYDECAARVTKASASLASARQLSPAPVEEP